MQSIAMSEFWQLNLEHQFHMSSQHLPSDEPVLPCPVPFQTSFVGCLPTVPCHASMVQLREPHVKSVESDQKLVLVSSCLQLVPVPLTDNHAGTVHVPPSMYLPKAAWFPLSPKTKELCTIIYWYVTKYVHLIWPFLIKYCNGWKMPNKRHVVNAVSWRSWLASVLLLLIYVTQILTCQLQAGS